MGGLPADPWLMSTGSIGSNSTDSRSRRMEELTSPPRYTQRKWNSDPRPRNWEQAVARSTIRWSPGAVTEGWHRLVLVGDFEDNTQVDKEIVFYHRPRLAPGASGDQRR